MAGAGQPAAAAAEAGCCCCSWRRRSTPWCWTRWTPCCRVRSCAAPLLRRVGLPTARASLRPRPRPSPCPTGADFFAKRDWRRASRTQRKAARRAAGDGHALLRMLARGLAAVRRRSRGRFDRDFGRDRAGRRVPDTVRAYRELRSERGCFQLVAASATVSRALVSQLHRLLPLPHPPEIISTEAAATPAAEATGARAAPRPRGPGGVAVPHTIEHYRAEAGDAVADKAAAAAAALRTLAPRAALLVLPDEGRLGEFVSELRAAGVTQAVALHEALGFPSRAAAAASGAPAAASPAALLRTFPARLGAAADGAAGGRADEQPPLVLVTTEASARGSTARRPFAPLPAASLTAALPSRRPRPPRPRLRGAALCTAHVRHLHAPRWPHRQRARAGAAALATSQSTLDALTLAGALCRRSAAPWSLCSLRRRAAASASLPASCASQYGPSVTCPQLSCDQVLNKWSAEYDNDMHMCMHM